jgi:hypothetical protein
MSSQEFLLEEIKHQPEPVLRELRHYLEFLKRQYTLETTMEKVVAETWEKLGPAPEVDYDRL